MQDVIQIKFNDKTNKSDWYVSNEVVNYDVNQMYNLRLSILETLNCLETLWAAAHSSPVKEARELLK